MVKNPSEGLKKKKIFDQDVGLLETCLESVPSTFIITIIAASTRENMNTIILRIILYYQNLFQNTVLELCTTL